MIMRKKDNTYKQVGFKKMRQEDGTYKDVEYQYSKDSNGDYKLTFEKGFTREIEGVLPLSLSGIGKDLKDYRIEGNAYQSDGITPDTPQEVVGCGDRTGNLFDGEYEVGSISTTTGELLSNSQRYRATNFIPVIPDTTYTFSKSSGTGFFWVIGYKDDFTGVEDGDSSFPASLLGDGELNEKTVVTFTTTPTTRYIKWYTTTKSGVPTQLNSGSTPLPYEPYGYKVDVVCRGKNLFDKDNTTVYQAFINVNNYWFSTTDGSKSIRIPVEANTTYTLSMGVSPTIFRICESDLEDPMPTGIQVSRRIIYDGNINKYTFTTSSTAKFIIFQGSSAVFDEWFNTLQLEFGTEVTEYSPYVEPITTTVYLDTPLHKIGNYTDVLSYSGKSVERPIKELILTGDEDWKKSSNYLGNFYARVLFNLRSLGDDAYCTHATQVKIPITTEKLVYGTFATESLYDNSAIVDLFIGQPEWTVDDFKSYLAAQYAAGTPVKVYYVLSTPNTKTVEPVEVPTLDGTTIIEVETEVKPSNVYLKYKSSK